MDPALLSFVHTSGLYSLAYFNSMFLAVLELPEAERQRKEQAERQAKLDEIAEKQRQRERELEEKERLRREALLGRPTEGPLKPSQPPTSPRPLDTGSAAVPAPAAAAAAPSSGKYVPRFRRGSESSGQAPTPESDRWGSSSSRQDDRMSQAGDRWRSDDRRSSGGSSFGGAGGSRSTWSSSRIPTRGSER